MHFSDIINCKTERCGSTDSFGVLRSLIQWVPSCPCVFGRQNTGCSYHMTHSCELLLYDVFDTSCKYCFYNVKTAWMQRTIIIPAGMDVLLRAACRKPSTETYLKMRVWTKSVSALISGSKIKMPTITRALRWRLGTFPWICRKNRIFQQSIPLQLISYHYASKIVSGVFLYFTGDRWPKTSGHPVV